MRGVVLVFRDLTERHALERELTANAARLEEADRRKDVFLATLAHELRNPLAPIRNGLAILRQAAPGSQAAVRARELMERQLGLLGMLCSLLPSFTAALQQALSQAHGSSQQAQLLNAALSILGAAAKAADSQAQLGAAGQQAAGDTVQLAADVALLAVQHPQFGV